MIRAENLTKKFGKTLAVDNLNFEIGEGEIFGFVGSNGAGKSTTIKIAVGLLKPNSGTIYIDDCDVTKKDNTFKSKIGYVPDFFGVYDDLLVTEYMNFYCGIHKVPKEKRAETTDKLLELVALSDKKDAYVDSLSRGMKQRLCLARALVHNPKVLILDEPASGLDPRARVDFRNILFKLKEMDKTILISSHILSELAEICTSIGIIDKGKMRAIGSVAEIQQQLRQQSKITLKANNETALIEAKLKEMPHVSSIQLVNGNLEFAFMGDDNAKSNLLKNLINSGINIYHFEEKGGSLESIFLELTAEDNND